MSPVVLGWVRVAWSEARDIRFDRRFAGGGLMGRHKDRRRPWGLSGIYTSQVSRLCGRAWDCMAGFCLVREAGGKGLAFPASGPEFLNGHPVLAANPSCYDELLQLHMSNL